MEKEIYFEETPIFIGSDGPLSPKLVIILIAVMPIAIILDAIGIVIVLTGTDDLGIVDIIGAVTILPLLSFIGASNLDERMQYLKQIQEKLKSAPETSPAQLEKLAKKIKFLNNLKWLRPIVSFLGEICVWIGGLLPFWTIFTFWTMWDIIKS